MSVLLITPQDQAKIDAMVIEARQNYIPWAVLQDTAILDDKPTLMLKDRVSGIKRPESRTIQLGHFRVSISFEEQPIGICRHISVSVRSGLKLPHPQAFRMICKAFGFKRFDRTWTEEFEPKCYAVNAIEVTEERKFDRPN